VSVETCDDLIAQENDHLKREVKKLELEVNKLKKQAKVQPPQDNRSNVVKKLEKEKNCTKDCFSTFKEASSK
jgi:sugar-specific transcriptional regulator TrmB